MFSVDFCKTKDCVEKGLNTFHDTFFFFQNPEEEGHIEHIMAKEVHTCWTLSKQQNFRLDQIESICSQPIKQEGHDGPVSLHWLIREIHSYQTLHYLGIDLKHKTPYKD